MTARPEYHSLDLTADATAFEMVDRLALLKEQEAALQARRWAIEARLVECLQFEQALRDQGKNSGSKTFKVFDGETSLRVQLTQGYTHKIDPATLREVEPIFKSEGVALPVRYKPELIVSQLDGLQAMHPSLWRTFQRALTSKPSKINVSLVK